MLEGVEWIQAIILGLVQGLTEFLPISSSAHLRIVGQLLPEKADPALRSPRSPSWHRNRCAPLLLA